jgi:hypothetical protein
MASGSGGNRCMHSLFVDMHDARAVRRVARERCPRSDIGIPRVFTVLRLACVTTSATRRSATRVSSVRDSPGGDIWSRSHRSSSDRNSERARTVGVGARSLIATAAVAVAIALAAVALFAAAGGPGGKPAGVQSQSGAGSSHGQPVAIGHRRGLLKLDPRTLEPLPGRPVPRGGLFFRAWSLSRDHSKLVFGPEPGPARLRFVNLERMHLFADDLRLAPRRVVVAAAWPATRPALAVTEGSCCPLEATLHVVDPVAGRVVARRRLHGSIQGIARFRNGLVLLLGPGRSVGASRLAVIDARGGVRSVSLPRTRTGHGGPGEERYPGLALDPVQGRAFVVGAGEPVAEVDLDSMRVSYHDLSEPISLFGRLRDWLEPEAHADFAP